MRKENEELESPKRSIRDSGYIDCWDSERSDSLSPPRHGRDDSFDSLDSFGSRSQQTPSPEVLLRGSSDGRGSDSESDQPHRRLPDIRKDDMSARRVSFGENKAPVPFNQYLPNKSNQTSYMPAPLRKKKIEQDCRKSWSTATSPSGERPFRSMSMCDMRYEDEGTLLPHSRAHHEHLQFVNDLLKEEDDTWQTDLARWKTRRRSASQDLIKKEEERKKMERLLSGEGDLSERRKSIKTYREIVEEKEHRERELHEAYKNAKTKEEANMILQKYIERFTISEAVLERIVMPKILERSQSVEPSLLSSPEDPNPLKYLRQQSLPSPKFTSTVEATISPTMEPDLKAPVGLTSPTKSVTSKAVPMLSPKPYSQPKNTQHVLKTFKVDGKVSVNGETLNGTEEQKEREHNADQTRGPSLTRSQMFEGVARVDRTATRKSDVSSVELHLTRQNAQNAVEEEEEEVISETTNHTKEVDREDTGSVHMVQAAEEPTQPSIENKECIITSLEFTPSPAKSETVENGAGQEEAQKDDTKPLPMVCNIKETEVIVPQIQGTPENGQDPPQREHHGDAEPRESPAAVVPPLNPSSRFGSWDPELERRRQELWQQEQERLLQEKYRKEQEKLKEEWEKAQKEVEEEERKYFEEEKKIIEDTVMPLTVSPATSQHRSICEMNGNVISSQREQDNPSGVAFLDGQSHEKNDTHSTDDNSQVSWTPEEALHRAEEQMQITDTSRLRTDKKKPIMDNENDYRQQQYTKPSNHQLQLGETESCITQEETSLHNFLESNTGQPRSPSVESKGLDSLDNPKDSGSSQSQSPNRSVSGKKLCSTCGVPLGKGAAMIIETLSLYFHIQCFKCGICKGQLGDATTGTDVRIRNGLLNCNDCYARSRTAGHPTPL